VTPRRTLSFAAALLAAAGATSCATRAPSQVRDERGLTITDHAWVGSGARGDFQRAVGLLEQQQYAAAIPVLVQVTEAAPKLTTPYIDLGIAYSRVGDLEHAKASLEKAVELNPRHPAALNELGVVYRKLGRFADARRSYEQALEQHPDFHFARLNLAILCDLYLADAKCALEQYERYAQAVPADEKAAMWLADLRNRTGR
jgi:Flp pilus assembly protein TadD